MRMKKYLAMFLAVLMLTSFCGVYVNAADYYTIITDVSTVGRASGSTYDYYKNVYLVDNANGPTLAVSSQSGVSLIREESTGLYFKDLNKNGKLDPYEDWRLSTLERAQNLVGMMDLDKKIALMTHGTINAENGTRFAVQRSSGKSTMAEGNNKVQEECETVDWGIPAVRSTDPRHTGVIDAGYFDGEDTTISRWPNQIAMTATYDPAVFTRFGEIVSAEYRAIGIQMMLGPQMDMITEPRWSRAGSSFTEDLVLNADVAGAFIEAMQTDTAEKPSLYGLDEDWGAGSVATMAKHWPSGGNGEAGFDGHTDDGKFGVYPGNSFESVMDAFANGAGFKPVYKDTTRQSASVMPYYTIPFDQDPSGKNVGNNFSSYIVQQRLRDDLDYDGMVCTDWGIQSRMYWGVEDGKGYTTAYRILCGMLAGIDQQGGYSTLSVMKEAYDMGVNGSTEFGIDPLGEDYMNALVDKSATRVLKIIFNLGMFENPYADPDYAEKFVGSNALNQEAYEVHKSSITMVKNADILPLSGKTTAYIPDMPGNTVTPVMNETAVGRHYNVTKNPDEADFAIIKLTSPTPPQSSTNAQNLQFGPHIVTQARAQSIGFDWVDAEGNYLHFSQIPADGVETADKMKSNRSVLGRTHPGDPTKLAIINDTIAAMGDKPIIFILNMTNPTVPAEFEPYVDAILIGNNNSDFAYMEVITGAYEPNGLLAVNLPVSMDAVDAANEDEAHDMEVYVDSEGNEYQFGFGMNWDGVIKDARTAQYADDINVPEPGAKVGISLKGPAVVEKGTEGTFKVAANNMNRLATATIWFEGDRDYFDFKDFKGLNGFEVIGGIKWESKGGSVYQGRVTLSNMEGGITSKRAKDILAVTLGAKTKIGTSEIKINRIELSGYDENDVAVFCEYEIKAGAITVGVSQGFSRYDVNRDGRVDQLDLTTAQLYYAAKTGDANWAEAVYADVNGDGRVDIEDLILILNNIVW